MRMRGVFPAQACWELAARQNLAHASRFHSSSSSHEREPISSPIHGRADVGGRSCPSSCVRRATRQAADRQDRFPALCQGSRTGATDTARRSGEPLAVPPGPRGATDRRQPLAVEAHRGAPRAPRALHRDELTARPGAGDWHQLPRPRYGSRPGHGSARPIIDAAARSPAIASGNGHGRRGNGEGGTSLLRRRATIWAASPRNRGIVGRSGGYGLGRDISGALGRRDAAGCWTMSRRSGCARDSACLSQGLSVASGDRRRSQDPPGCGRWRRPRPSRRRRLGSPCALRGPAAERAGPVASDHWADGVPRLPPNAAFRAMMALPAAGRRTPTRPLTTGGSRPRPLFALRSPRHWRAVVAGRPSCPPSLQSPGLRG